MMAYKLSSMYTGKRLMSNGKGDSPRPFAVEPEVFDQNHERTFGRKKRWYELRDEAVNVSSQNDEDNAERKPIHDSPRSESISHNDPVR